MKQEPDDPTTIMINGRYYSEYVFGKLKGAGLKFESMMTDSQATKLRKQHATRR